MRRREFVAGLFGGAAALPFAPHLANAQAYPARPVRIIVGVAPGGTLDVTARLIGQWLSDRLGQQFVVENRPGGGNIIGTEAVVRAPPDGYTLLLVSAANAINAALYDKLNFDFVRDIAPVASISRVPLVMVVNSLVAAKTVPEFLADAKSNPGKLSMASGGNGSAAHLAGELLKIMAGVNIVHVPYRGGALALTDLLGGQVQMSFSPVPDAIEHIRAGKLRPLAVTTATREEALPEVPTMGEFLPGYEASTWNGLGAPRNTPPEIITQLNQTINAGLADPKTKARITDLGGSVMPSSSAEFGKLIADEAEKWAKVIRAANIKTQ